MPGQLLMPVGPGVRQGGTTMRGRWRRVTNVWTADKGVLSMPPNPCGLRRVVPVAKGGGSVGTWMRVLGTKGGSYATPNCVIIQNLDGISNPLRHPGCGEYSAP